MSILSWVKLGAILTAVLFVMGYKHQYDERRRGEGRAEIQAKWEVDKAARIRAFSDKQREYVEASLEAEQLKKDRDAELFKRQQDAKRRLAAIPKDVADTRIPVVAGVLNGTDHSAGTAPAAGQPERDPTGSPANSDTTVGLWAQWSETMKGLYESCRSEVIGLVTHYNNLREKSKQPALDALNLPH